MAGANALEGDAPDDAVVPQVRRPEQAKEFRTFHNYSRRAAPEAFDRRLGARGSQAAADAAGEGVQPPGVCRSAAAAASAKKRRCRL